MDCHKQGTVFFLLLAVLKVNSECQLLSSKTVLKCANIKEAARHWNLDNSHRNQIKLFQIGTAEQNSANLSKITSFSFEDSLSLEDFRIYGSINEVQTNIFKKFTQLQYLLLNNNFLPWMKNSTFSDLRLISMDLQNNEIQFIQPGTFRDSLTTQLYLDHNKLTVLIPNQLPEAEVVSLGYNELSFIENGALSRKLKILDVTSNFFNDVAYLNVDNFADLNTLILAKNQLESIDSFPDLPNLETLSLFKNRITNINPEALKKLPVLKTLNLCSNKLKKLPNLHIIPSLANLYVSNNLLQFIDFAPYRLSSVSIYGNPFTCKCLDMINDQLARKKVNREECESYMNGSLPRCFAFAYNCKEILDSVKKQEQIAQIDEYFLMLDFQNSSCVNFEEEHNYYKKIIPKK